MYLCIFQELADDMSSHWEDVNKLRRERDDAQREVQYFRTSLCDKDRDCLSLEDELERSRQVDKLSQQTTTCAKSTK